MKKWRAGAVFGIIILGVLFSFYTRSEGEDVHYDSPEQVQNRPDVEKELLKKFSHSKKLQKAALEYARQFQVAISFPELAREIYTKVDKASMCFDALYGSNSHIPSREIEALVVNTYGRAKAYLKYNANLSGYMYEVPTPNVADCHFDVNSMEN